MTWTGLLPSRVRSSLKEFSLGSPSNDNTGKREKAHASEADRNAVASILSQDNALLRNGSYLTTHLLVDKRPKRD